MISTRASEPTGASQQRVIQCCHDNCSARPHTLADYRDRHSIRSHLVFISDTKARLEQDRVTD